MSNAVHADKQLEKSGSRADAYSSDSAQLARSESNLEQQGMVSPGPGMRSPIQLAQGLNTSPRVAAQRKLADVLAGRAEAGGRSAAQLKKSDEEELSGALNGNHPAQRKPNNTHESLDQRTPNQARFDAMRPAQLKDAPVIQRRTSVGGRTIVTEQNSAAIPGYIELKRAYDQSEADKEASRGQAPRTVERLGTIPIEEIVRALRDWLPENAPGITIEQATAVLRDWANAKAPSEVSAEIGESIPLVSTQDNSFTNLPELFRALTANIRAEQSRQEQERIAFEVLANLERYEPVLTEILGKINQRLENVSADVFNRLLRSGYTPYLLGNLPRGKVDLVQLVIRNERDALRKLYLAMSTIHSFALLGGRPRELRDMTAALGGRRDKYSPYGPEIESARDRGLAVWAGFSGSTADILYVARNLGVSQSGINQLADLAVAFFTFLPTSLNPTHTLHEVMLVANRYFNVPYDPANPRGTLPSILQPVASGATGGTPETREEPRRARL